MIQIIPKEHLMNYPCSVVAVASALNLKDKDIEIPDKLKSDGYLTLEEMNKYIRKNLKVKKKEYFKRDERKTLTELFEHNDKKAIVCLLGHYIYVDSMEYYSFFNNDDDPVVCIWWLAI